MYPDLYHSVITYMIHEPNCEGQSNSPLGACINEKGKCRRHFPNDFQNKTKESVDGYPIYK